MNRRGRRGETLTYAACALFLPILVLGTPAPIRVTVGGESTSTTVMINERQVSEEKFGALMDQLADIDKSQQIILDVRPSVTVSSAVHVLHDLNTRGLTNIVFYYEEREHISRPASYLFQMRLDMGTIISDSWSPPTNAIDTNWMEDINAGDDNDPEQEN